MQNNEVGEFAQLSSFLIGFIFARHTLFVIDLHFTLCVIFCRRFNASDEY